eukprot:3508592-Amphidinium_carterae.1
MSFSRSCPPSETSLTHTAKFPKTLLGQLGLGSAFPVVRDLFPWGGSGSSDGDYHLVISTST